ncbi:hypothetical protein [Aeromonas jandaei]|uniref:hypothetical protein n=1 Tax=Aeromonas jandaei TaxID=650 RepID=UPI003B9F4ED3
MSSIKEIKKAFELLYLSMNNASFSKSQKFSWWNEKALLPNIRFYLLGYFGRGLEPEIKTELISAPTREGYLDFGVNNSVIEFAVRLPNESASKLTAYANRTEREKLIRRKFWHDWAEHGVLVLFDFSDKPLSNEQLEEYREKPCLGPGNHKIDGFSVLYYNYINGQDECCIRKNIKFY